MHYKLVKGAIASVSLSLLFVVALPQKAISNSNDARTKLEQLMMEIGWRNIEIQKCRIRFEYGRVPPCEDGKPQFFEQDFRLQNVQWHKKSDVFEARANYFVTFESRFWYFQKMTHLPRLGAEIKRKFPSSKWPVTPGPETKEISEFIYSRIPRTSPYNWRFFHTCFGEVPSLEDGLTLIFESESDAQLIPEALVSYAISQDCSPDKN